MSAYTDDRRGRALRAHDIFAGVDRDHPRPRGHRPVGELELDRWVRAVEMVENRPTAGASPGEKLHGCLKWSRALLSDTKWHELGDEQRGRYESMAAGLRVHR